METKDSDRGSLPASLGSGDAKPAQPASNVKNEVCLGVLFIWILLLDYVLFSDL